MAYQNLVSRMYSNIDPRCEWVQGDEFNTLKVDVSGFKKEELKAQVDTSRNLKVSGEHNLEGNKWCRFQKSFQLPKGCEIGRIKAKIDNGLLYVMVPNSSTMDRIPSEVVRNTMPTAEQPANEASYNENNGHSQEGQDMQQDFCSLQKPQRGVARNLLKQKFVILNVVIAAVLLALVLFRRYKLADGDNINHDSNTAFN